MKKVIKFIVIGIAISLVFTNIIFASGITDPIEQADFYKPKVQGENSKLIEIGKTILNVIQLIAVVIAVATLIFTGIRYMYGGIESKANFKETMIPYIIGVFMTFAITTILQIVYDFANGINNS
ncbi:MAG: hypothetical protein HFJ53_05340 [Clostridia bacterium]|jgi:hypothetical protein|nr:hypothetical protein [Clostridia bacterium]